MLIFITGIDSFLAKRAIDQIKKKYIAKNKDGAELLELTPDSVINWADLLAVPLFASSRLVVIRSAGRFLAKDQESLVYFVQHLPETTVLVVWDEKDLPASGPLLPTLTNEAKQTISVAPLIGSDLENWLAKQAKELGVDLTSELKLRVIEQCGSDLWAIESELIFLSNSNGRLSERAQTNELEKFGAFRLVRAKKWLELAEFVREELVAGLPIELIIGGVASAVRQNLTDQRIKAELTDLLLDVDVGLKTGLLDEEAAGALLVSYLPKSMAGRVQWERIWEEVTF